MSNTVQPHTLTSFIAAVITVASTASAESLTAFNTRHYILPQVIDHIPKPTPL